MRKRTWIGIAVAVLILIGIIANHGDGKSDSASVDAASAAAVNDDVVSGRINGRFKRDCFLCSGNMQSYIDTSDVWCGWDGDNVIVHVLMTNNSVEHVTVNWHPSYTIVGGGEHGTGLTSVQSDGFDSGETRDLEAHQNPNGVEPGSEIGICKPSFNTVESG
jgi:hypothetical protein